MNAFLLCHFGARDIPFTHQACTLLILIKGVSNAGQLILVHKVFWVVEFAHDYNRKWHAIYSSSINPHPFAFSLFSHFCIGLSSTLTMSSVLAGMFLNTSALSRLSMCGPSRSCSFLIWSSLEMSANSSRKPSRLLETQRQRQSELCECVIV